MISPVSAAYFGIPGYAIFWVLFALAFGLFLQRAYLLFRLVRLGREAPRFDNLAHRIRLMLFETVLQWCSIKSVSLRRKDLAGIGHSILFFGFGLFLLGYLIFIIIAGGFGVSALPGSTFELVYNSILDIVALLVAIALVWAFIRRYIIKAERLTQSRQASIILSVILALMVLQVLVNGFGYAAYNVPGSWPPFSSALAKLLKNSGVSGAALITAYKSVWWLHFVLILSFLVYIPRSKHLHILASFANITFQNLNPKGALNTINLDLSEPFGVSKIQDFSWKSLLDLYACAECGRCQASCPAQISGKNLNPREMISNLKYHLQDAGPELIRDKNPNADIKKSMIGQVVLEDEIWACTTCHACEEVCPVRIEPMAKIIEMRRNLVDGGHISNPVARALESMKILGNPWEYQPGARNDWAKNLKAHVLKEEETSDTVFWVGCAGAYNPLGQQVANAMLSIMQKTDINYGILGEEKCCGAEARRLGEEGLFQALAGKNIQLLNRTGVKRVITFCPHCYNTLKNEYPQLGGRFEVRHHTEFLDEITRQGKIKLTRGLKDKVTFHDPCYLGRYNGVFEAPRRLLGLIPELQLVEMGDNRDRAFCCGGGGGQLWAEASGGERINYLRLKDVQEATTSMLATACPFCKIMLDDAAAHSGVTGEFKIKDIAELISEAI